jgi:allophanate hydrolase
MCSGPQGKPFGYPVTLEPPSYLASSALAAVRHGYPTAQPSRPGVRIEAGGDLGRERLCRYGSHPPVSLERLRRLPGGRVAYRLEYRPPRLPPPLCIGSIELEDGSYTKGFLCEPRAMDGADDISKWRDGKHSSGNRAAG